MAVAEVGVDASTPSHGVGSSALAKVKRFKTLNCASIRLFDPLQTAAGRAHAPGLLLTGPSDTADRFQIQRNPFVETHYPALLTKIRTCST